jgi:hypothetical protein
MNRRGFLLGMLAAASAPAIVKVANLMPVVVRGEAGYTITGFLKPVFDPDAYGVITVDAPLTNFAELTAQQKLIWSRAVWKAARESTFCDRFVQSGLLYAPSQQLTLIGV